MTTHNNLSPLFAELTAKHYDKAILSGLKASNLLIAKTAIRK